MGDTSLMIRQPALQVLSHLQEMPQGANSPPKFIFCILLVLPISSFLQGNMWFETLKIKCSKHTAVVLRSIMRILQEFASTF